jgi:hypothetical protein
MVKKRKKLAASFLDVDLKGQNTAKVSRQKWPVSDELEMDCG